MMCSASLPIASLSVSGVLNVCVSPQHPGATKELSLAPSVVIAERVCNV